ncbi:MAG: WG repeat-containing protein [Clostridiales bacterium]|nr:WG repeat-containing protein [Clostridiales bacterium]
MICSHCGADNTDDAVECTQCGEPLKSAADKNVKKKSNAAYRIRKISVENVDSHNNPGRRKATENTLEDMTAQLPELTRNEKIATVEDTLDLSGFHLEEVELKEMDLEDSDRLDLEKVVPVSAKDSGNRNYGGLKPPGKGKKALWVIMGAIFIVIIAAVVIFTFLWKKPKKDYADIILEGNRYYREANYGKAEDTYFKALEMNPEGAEGYFCLSDVYIAMNDTQRAVEILEQGYERTGSEQLLEKAGELTGDKNISESGGETTLPEDTVQTKNLPTDNAVAKPSGESALPANASNVIVWSLEPSIVADNIMPVLGCTPEEDIYATDVSMIVQNGLAGLVNISGQIVLEPQYRYILKCSGQLYAVMPDGSSRLLNEDYTLNEDGSHNHSQFSYSYLWDDSQKTVFRMIHNAEGTTVEENPFQMGENMLVPVIAGTRESFSLDHPKYALASSQGLCTDFIYENTGKSSWEGMIAVLRDGKWGFCNSKGEEVIPCEYDGAEYVDVAAQEGLSYTQAEPYGYSGGYAAVKKDGLWGFLDKNGNIAVPFVFDEARPVQGENAWVKYQGKWGKVSLAGNGGQTTGTQESQSGEAAPAQDVNIPQTAMDVPTKDTGNIQN